MADEDLAVNPETAPAEPADDGFVAREADLQDLFQNAEPNIPPIEDEKPTEESPAAVPDPRLDDISTQIQELRDARVSDQTTINILRDQLREAQQRGTQQQQPPPPAIVPPDEEAEIARFRTESAADPARAIYNLIKKNKGPDIDPSQIVAQANASAQRTMEITNMYNDDRARTVAEYGSLLKDKAFANMAEQVYRELTNGSPMAPDNSIKWHPRAMYTAASIAYAQLHKSGQLPSSANPKVVKMPERKPRGQNPLIGSTTEDQPRSLASDIPARDLAIMKRTAESMGISLQRYLKILDNQQKADPHYGR